MQLIILIGLQASGKSTFARERFFDCIYISKDAMRNVKKKEQRQQRLLREALAKGHSVVVDNTNPSRADRAALITIGQEFGAEIVGYFFASRINDCLERNRQREGAACVPDVALYTTRARLECQRMRKALTGYALSKLIPKVTDLW